MKTIEDLKKYIASEYGVSPISFDGNILKYRAITFAKNTGSVILANKKSGDLWTVKRAGHSIDFFTTEELSTAIDLGGSLLYFFMPENQINE